MPQVNQLGAGAHWTDGVEAHVHPRVQWTPAGPVESGDTQGEPRLSITEDATDLVDLLVDLAAIPCRPRIDKVRPGAQVSHLFPEGQPELGVGPLDLESRSNGVFQAGIAHHERSPVGRGAKKLILQTDPRGRVIAPLGPELGVGVIAAGD